MGEGRGGVSEHISELLVCRVATRQPSPATNRPCKLDLKRRDSRSGERNDNHRRKNKQTLFSNSVRNDRLPCEGSFIIFLCQNTG